jgi:hypothetical protein
MKCFRFREHFRRFGRKRRKKIVGVKMFRSVPHVLGRPRLSGDPAELMADPSRARRMMPMVDEGNLPYQEDDMFENLGMDQRFVNLAFGFNFLK